MAPEYQKERATQVIASLLARGILTTEHLGRRIISISERPSRNSVSVIECSDLARWIHKEARADQPWSYARLRAEAVFYSLVSNHSNFSFLKSSVPKLLDFDPEMGCIVTTAILPDVTFHDWWIAHRQFPTIAFDRLGATLARLHDIPIAGFADKDEITAPRPWVLDLGNGTTQPVKPRNSFASSLLQAAESSVLSSYANSLRSEWKCASFIHGDLRLANLLIGKMNRTPRILDWEMFGLGDPLWDIGSLFAAVLQGPVLEQPPKVSNATNASVAFERALRAYQASPRKPFHQSHFCRIIGCAALRLAQISFEYAQASSHARHLSPKLLEAALNLLRNTERLAKSLQVAGKLDKLLDQCIYEPV